MKKKKTAISIFKKYKMMLDDDSEAFEVRDFTKEQAVKAYMKIALKLQELQVGACKHISRADNLDMFETRFRIEKIAERIAKEYGE